MEQPPRAWPGAISTATVGWPVFGGACWAHGYAVAVVIANYGGSKQVDNDDGSLFCEALSLLTLACMGLKDACLPVQIATTTTSWPLAGARSLSVVA